MTDLRNHLRGIYFHEKELLNKCSVIDGIIIDLCPIADKYEKQCKEKNSKFNQQTKLIPIFLIIMQRFSNWNIKIEIPFFKKVVYYKFDGYYSFSILISLR